MSIFDMHMKVIHKESEYSRINRLTQQIQSVINSDANKNNVYLKSMDCAECGLCFISKEEQKNHNQQKHNVPYKSQEKVNVLKNQMKEEVFSATVRIEPDQDFLTKSTADLKAMLESISKESLHYEEDAFEMDFKLVLNSVEDIKDTGNNTRYQCDQCKFRGHSRRCLRAFITFVHE